ncbi:hypothetical protein B0A49_14026, partial [Cryomyces minteri]
NMSRQCSRTTSRTQNIEGAARLWSLPCGTRLARRSTTVCDRCLTPKPIFSLFASRLTAQIRWRMSWTRQ